MLNQMWELKLKSPTAVVRSQIHKSWNRSIIRMGEWTVHKLLPAMVYGGMGIDGIAQTDFYRFITSPNGLSQLGIRPQDAPKILTAYVQSFTLTLRGSTLVFRFGNEAELKLGTPHWATGTGKLKVDSWMDWILDGEKVEDAGYVPRDAVPKGMQKAIRLKDPLGGLMLPPGVIHKERVHNAGTWEFPPRLQKYMVDWLKNNESALQNAITSAFVAILESELK